MKPLYCHLQLYYTATADELTSLSESLISDDALRFSVFSTKALSTESLHGPKHRHRPVQCMYNHHRANVAKSTHADAARCKLEFRMQTEIVIAWGQADRHSGPPLASAEMVRYSSDCIAVNSRRASRVAHVRRKQ